MPQDDSSKPKKSEEFIFSPLPRWSDRIPEYIQGEIGDAVREQAVNLPANLFVELYTPDSFLERRWFVEAAAYIYIPHPQYWRNDTMPNESELHRPNETLSPFPELLRVAEVNSESEEQAMNLWEETPPDSRFPDILRAEPEDYQEET